MIEVVEPSADSRHECADIVIRVREAGVSRRSD
jgi:hypothetical protein